MRQNPAPIEALTTPLELALRMLPRPRRSREGTAPVLPGFPASSVHGREHPLDATRRLIETALRRMERCR